MFDDDKKKLKSLTKKVYNKSYFTVHNKCTAMFLIFRINYNILSTNYRTPDQLEFQNYDVTS